MNPQLNLQQEMLKRQKTGPNHQPEQPLKLQRLQEALSS